MPTGGSFNQTNYGAPSNGIPTTSGMNAPPGGGNYGVTQPNGTVVPTVYTAPANYGSANGGTSSTTTVYPGQVNNMPPTPPPSSFGTMPVGPPVSGGYPGLPH